MSGNDAGRRALNSMNYFLLRGIFKENYPESVKEELSYFLEGVVLSLTRTGCKDIDAIEALYDYAYQEISEGEYAEDIASIPSAIRDWCQENTDLDDSDITQIFRFYGELCCDIIENKLKNIEQEM